LEVGGGSLKELDFLLFLFPRLLKSAMQQGMYKKYVKKEYNDSNIRGVININRHIRYNDPPNGRIAYTTREFSYDNDITQLIRHTIEYMSTIPMGRALLNSDKEVEQYTRQIIQVTPLYQKGERRRVITANRTPLSHPYYNRYKALQQICLAILRKEKMSHGSMSNKVHGLLIDVAWLWEEYIGIIMREEGFTHHTNKTAFKLFTRIEDCYEEGKNFQNIIPDYVWEQGDKKIIADAKYIPLHRFHKTDAERASAIYYKTIMYMYRFATNIGFLFHPCSFEEAKDYDVTFQDYEIANGKNCHLYKVGLVIPDSNKEYKDFKNEIKEREELQDKITTLREDIDTLTNELNAEIDNRVNADKNLQKQIDENKVIPADEDNSVVIIAGSTDENNVTTPTTIKVNLDSTCEHLKLGENGIYFDGYFGTF
jgi:5-methylcytosine-specific restriction endonuclease McrBC regulatory subunit McrC